MSDLIKRRDLILDLWVVLFGIVGLFSIYSVSPFYLNYQVVFFAVAVIAYFIISSLSTRYLNYFTIITYFIVLAGLLYLHFFGQSTRGSAAWINFGFINFQPSEFSKIIVLLLIAKIFSRTDFLIKKYLLFFITVIPILLLIFLEPDFGNFFVLLFSVIFTFFIIYIDFKRLVLLFLFLFLSGFLLYSFVLKPYQKQRINSFLFQQNATRGANYNLNQSIIAIGSGGMFGQGIKNNSQVILNFLPEPHTDFIFSATSEIYGFMYSFLLTIFILLFLIYLYYKYLLRFNSLYNLLVSSFIFSIFLIQVILNMGMTVGILPITGITLPFISYGGSSLITFYILFSILANINLKSRF